MNKRDCNVYIYAFWAAMAFERSIWTIYLLDKGISLVEIGILQTSLAVAMFFFEFPSGLLADKFGEKITLVLGHICNIFYLLIMLLTSSFELFLAGFIFYGMGFSMISGSDQTLLYNQDDGKEYQEKIGIYNAILIISLSTSSFLGGVFSKFSWNLVFIIGITAQIISLLTLKYIRTKNKKESNNRNLLDVLMSVKLFIKGNTKLKFLMLAIVTFQSVLSVLYNFSQILFVEKGITSFELSVILTLAMIFSAVSSLLMNYLNKKFGRYNLIFTFMFVIGICGLLFNLNNIFFICIIFLIFEFSYEFIDTTLNSVFHEEITDNIRTSLVSGLNTLTSLFMIISNILFTVFLKFTDVSNIFMIGIIFTVIISMTCLLIYRKLYFLKS